VTACRFDSSYLPSQGMQSLSVLRADNNQLHYYLPSDWGAAANLSVLSLRKNTLSGYLPGGGLLYLQGRGVMCSAISTHVSGVSMQRMCYRGTCLGVGLQHHHVIVPYMMYVKPVI
jgi:hypothetical protein